MSDPDDTPAWEPPTIYCRHLLVCRSVWFDPNRPDDGFSLGKLVVQFRLPEGQDFPLRLPRLFAYAQLYGTPGEYQVRLRLIRIEADEVGDDVEIQLGPNDQPVEFLVPRPVVVSGLNLVEELAMPVDWVVFDRAGLYAVQIWAMGYDEPLASERVEVRT